MTVTINTVDGKSVQVTVTDECYARILETVQNESYLHVSSGMLEYIIVTQHIVTITVCR